MRAVVEYLAQSVVEHPEQVRVIEQADEQGTRYEIAVAADDMGKLIGRSGRTIQAIRTLVRALARHKGLRVGVEVLDAGRPQRERG